MGDWFYILAVGVEAIGLFVVAVLVIRALRRGGK